MMSTLESLMFAARTQDLTGQSPARRSMISISCNRPAADRDGLSAFNNIHSHDTSSQKQDLNRFLAYPVAPRRSKRPQRKKNCLMLGTRVCCRTLVLRAPLPVAIVGHSFLHRQKLLLSAIWLHCC